MTPKHSFKYFIFKSNFVFVSNMTLSVTHWRYHVGHFYFYRWEGSVSDNTSWFSGKIPVLELSVMDSKSHNWRPKRRFIFWLNQYEHRGTMYLSRNVFPMVSISNPSHIWELTLLMIARVFSLAINGKIGIGIWKMSRIGTLFLPTRGMATVRYFSDPFTHPRSETTTIWLH